MRLINQKEGNGNLDTVFAHSEQVCEFTSEIFHHVIKLSLAWEQSTVQGVQGEGNEYAPERARITYPKDGGIIRHSRWFRLGDLLLLLLCDANVFHITAPKDDVFVDTARGGDLFGRVPPSALSTV